MKNLRNITKKELILALIIVYGVSCIHTFISTLSSMLNYVGEKRLIAVFRALSTSGILFAFALGSLIMVHLLFNENHDEDDRTFLMRFEASKTSREEREKILDYVRRRLPIGSTLIVLPNDISLTEINPPREDRRRLEDVKNLLLQDAERLRKLGERKTRTI